MTGDRNVSTIPPPLHPILSAASTDDHQRHTWVVVQSPQELEPPPKRRVRSSAPAQLQSYIPARESLLLRGVQAQERRSKSKEDRPRALRQTPPQSPLIIDPERLDILEARVANLISMVQTCRCQHDWRASPRLRDLCPCGQSADYVSLTIAELKCATADGPSSLVPAVPLLRAWAAGPSPQVNVRDIDDDPCSDAYPLPV